MDTMLGHSFQQDASSTASQTGQGFPSEDFDVNSVAAEYTDVTSGLTSWALQSFMFRTTLKYHNRNIYSKLGVSSRKQLLAVAQQLP